MIGLALMGAGAWFVASSEGLPIAPTLLGMTGAWAAAAWLTDKYRHKYPQRYYTYLLASHGKAAAITAVALLAWVSVVPSATGIWSAAAVALVADLVASLPRVALPPLSDSPSFTARSANLAPTPEPLVAVSGSEIARSVSAVPDVQAVPGLSAFIARCLPPDDAGTSTIRVTDDDSETDEEQRIAMLVQMKSVNGVRRLNLFMAGVSRRVLMGGYFVFRYRPLDAELEALRAGRRGIRLWAAYGWHFLRHRALPKIPILEQLYFSRPFSFFDDWLYRRRSGNRRVISRAEMWGRVYYWGFDVVEEARLGTECWVLTRRVNSPHVGRDPSFYLIARLTKVGLDGRPMYLHKIRTMYPFSEFVQERVYRDHGLNEAGKFKNDFRLTDYGRFLRRYWLDEIPQLFDWLRGEIKLVGMRATSPHFLSLYPRELYELYAQTKPGLIPPIFDASTAGFDDIVRIEYQYLKDYQRRPVAADLRCLLKTLHDIVIRGVRSR
jgi:lipopolysaccharide/colanic/teichoic acid biosynthesis glycosyltransferase